MEYLIKIFIILCLFSSCSGPEKSEQDKLREQNAKGEFIYRKSSEVFYQPQPIKRRTIEKYSWEEKTDAEKK